MGVGAKAQIAVRTRETMGRIDHAIRAESVRHRREAHTHSGRRIHSSQGHHLHQRRSGMVHPSDGYPANALIGQGRSRRR
jgi:hypothetical protein